MKPAINIALGSRYRLVSRIAVGGMGEVWIAHDLSLARDVAVKVLLEEFAGDAGFLERFRIEARNSAQLSHQNIAQLYDYGEQDGSAFLVMELVLGEPMSDLLDREPVLPPHRLIPILAQTARALEAAHRANVVHRDIKPGNILISRGGRVKITDFGISTASNQVPMTASGMVMGTAQYLSPEQATGGAATPASDIYSLGIVAYEALVGKRPFTGATQVDIAIAHVNQPVPPLPDRVDPAMAALVLQMLAKRPEQRPESAARVAHKLDGMLATTPPRGIPSVPEPVVTRPPDPAPAVVPGRELAEAIAPEPAEPPPQFTPPKPVPRPMPHISRPPSTDRWWHDLRRSTVAGIPGPVLLAVVLLLFALLGAMVADRIWGPSAAAAEDSALLVTCATAAVEVPDGMIGEYKPALSRLTTARNP